MHLSVEKACNCVFSTKIGSNFQFSNNIGKSLKGICRYSFFGEYRYEHILSGFFVQPIFITALLLYMAIAAQKVSPRDLYGNINPNA